MSKIFTDLQVQIQQDNGHPMASLMEAINAHTNSREYAAEILAHLAEVAQENYEAEQRDRSKMIASLQARKVAQ